MWEAILCFKLTWLGSQSLIPEKEVNPQRLRGSGTPGLGCQRWLEGQVGLGSGVLSKSSLLHAPGSSGRGTQLKLSEAQFFHLKSREYYWPPGRFGAHSV